MIQELKNRIIIGSIDTCLSTDNRELFYISEDDTTNKSFIIPVGVGFNLDECLIVKNPQLKEINHISIDACLLTSQNGYNGQKCDLIVFDDKKLCFVELKTNAFSHKGAKKNIKKARKQLGATIDYFDDCEVDFSNYILEAYVVMKSQLYPSDQASIKARRKKFYDKYEVDLLESSIVLFA